MSYTPSAPNDYRGALYHAQSNADASAFIGEQVKRFLRTLTPGASVGTTALAEALWPAVDRLDSEAERANIKRFFGLLKKMPEFELAAWCVKGPTIQLYGRPAQPWLWRAPASEPDKSDPADRDKILKAEAAAKVSACCLYDEPDLDQRLAGLSNAADTGSETLLVYHPRQLASDMRARLNLGNLMRREPGDEDYWSGIAANVMSAICDNPGLDEELMAAAIVKVLKRQEVDV